MPSEIDKLKIIRKLTERIVKEIPDLENGESFSESSEADYTYRVIKQTLLQILVYMINDPLFDSQMFDEEMINFFSSKWRNGSFSEENLWFKKYSKSGLLLLK